MNCPYCNKESQAYTNVFGFHCHGNEDGIYHNFRYQDTSYDLIIGNEEKGYIKVKHTPNISSIRINNEVINIEPFEYQDCYRIILKYQRLLAFL